MVKWKSPLKYLFALCLVVFSSELTSANLYVGHYIERLNKSSTAEAPQNYSQAPRYCDYLLSTYLAGFGIAENLQEIARELEQARDLRGQTHQPFTTIGDLAPLFDQGLIYRMLGAELQARGHRSIESMEAALNLLATSRDSDSQIDLVDSVIHRLLKEIGPNLISFRDAKEIKKLEAKRKALGLSDLKTFTKLVEALKTEEGSNFALLQLALLDNLITSRGALVDAIKNQTSLLDHFGFFLRNNRRQIWPYWPDLNEATADAEANKIVQLKFKWIEAKHRQSSEGFDLDYINLLDDLSLNFVQWVNLDTKIAWILKLLDLSSFLISEETFQKALTFIDLQNMPPQKALPIVEKLGSLAKFYDGNNRERFETLRTYLERYKAPAIHNLETFD